MTLALGGAQPNIGLALGAVVKPASVRIVVGIATATVTDIHGRMTTQPNSPIFLAIGRQSQQHHSSEVTVSNLHLARSPSAV